MNNKLLLKKKNYKFTAKFQSSNVRIRFEDNKNKRYKSNLATILIENSNLHLNFFELI
jgi:hypothetical protein